MKRVRISRSTAALIAGALFAAPAAAQEMTWTTFTPAVAGTDTMGLVLREQMQRQRSGAGVPDPRGAAGASPAAPAPNLAALRYRPSKARRAANLAAFVKKTRAVDPGNAAALQGLFGSGDFIEKLGGVMAPMGLRVDNVADAYAIWWISAWNATWGNNPSPSRAMSQAVSGQIARAMSSTPELLNASDAAKQELAEALLVQMALFDIAVEQNKGNPAQLRALASAASQAARSMGIDLATVTLTENGFVPARSGSVTSGAPAEAMPGSAPARKNALASYGLIGVVAATVGAGAGWFGSGAAPDAPGGLIHIERALRRGLSAAREQVPRRARELAERLPACLVLASRA